MYDVGNRTRQAAVICYNFIRYQPLIYDSGVLRIIYLVRIRSLKKCIGNPKEQKFFDSRPFVGVLRYTRTRMHAVYDNARSRVSI